MTIEEAIRIINTYYKRALLPDTPCEGWDIQQMEKAITVLSDALEKAKMDKFG